ncbi:hypothetical protein GWO43_07010 [candidate division KSB1 bacterium]|nr:hypothetical protein [candidate division KSB1 bacterium]NIR72757.1 hypothetical protein [candidate division KSB1 bacterium]NIS23713.1 hypothetical protein [candidate division KSB1 bacterium]NIT70633.1 hypothetical protein [candidate division KSB1 bacterium]NIU24361.1 hypothetical protein [candidate division KSB1 bacterium]
MRSTILALLIFVWTPCASSQVAVIAHKSVPMDTIKKSELLDFYIGDIKRWSNDKPVIVLDLKSQCEAKDLFYDYLGKSPSRMKSLWLKKMLSGEGDPPESLESEDEMLKKVASTSGAIGFVSKPKISNKVKTLLVIEKEKKK